MGQHVARSGNFAAEKGEDRLVSLARTMAGKRRAKAGVLFAHSRLDALLVMITGLQLALIIWGLVKFPALSLAGLALFLLAHVLLSVTNYNTAAHNFVHSPFFASRRLNDLYAALCGITVMLPFTLLRIYHMEHHQYGNDPKDPVTGTTRDSTSTYLYGKDGGPEGLWRYSFLSPLRDVIGIAGAFETAMASRERLRIGVETAAIVAFWAALCWLNWKFALYYAVVVYLSLVATTAQNYFEHYGARPGSRKTDSVSCYNPLYNLLWFNNGYHQEHHFRAGVHWAKIKELRKEMAAEEERRVVRGAHFMNLPWLDR
jgi:fatty acid desaturase